MSCQHGNHVDDCDLCNELLSEYRAGVEIGKKDGWEACESCHGIVDGKHVELESLLQQVTLLRNALRFMHDEKCDYMRLNKLGDPLQETSARLALKALAATEPKRRGTEMNSYELEQALACKQMEVEDLRQQVAEQAEAIDLQLHTNRRIAELEQKLAKWVEKAKNWSASPEAGKQLEGYRTMGAKCAELEAECDQLRHRLTKSNVGGQPMSKISDMQDLLKPACDEDGHPITQRQWDELRQQFNAANKLITAYREESISKGGLK